MIKKIVCCVLMMVSVSSVMYGMQNAGNLVSEVEKIAASPQAKTVETELTQFANSSTGKTVIAAVENEGKILFADAEKFIESKFSHSTTTSTPTTSTTTTNTTTTSTTTTSMTAPIMVHGNEIPALVINSASQESSTNSLANSQVPSLNLRTAASSKLTTRGGQPKNVITSLNQLNADVAVGKKSARLQNESGSTQTTRLGQSAHISNAPKRSMLPSGMGDNDLISDLAIDNKTYSEADVWAIVEASNPSLYQFGIEHSMSLDSVMMYAQFLQEMKLKPAVLVEHVKTASKLGDKKPADWQLTEYKKIKKNEPEKWDAMVLEVLKAVVEQQDGEAKPSTLNSTHIGMLEDQVVTKDGHFKKSLIAFAVSALTTLGTIAWGIYGQAHPVPTNAPTNAPTHTPTYMPTFAPTLSPT